VRGLIVGARGEDVESITGFREGTLPSDWAERLRNRPDLPAVPVSFDVFRDEALAPRRACWASGRPAYNPGGSA
jgi:hypothetical protein